MIGFTALFNDTGNPAASLPLSISNSGLPVGRQLVADFGNEALLFCISSKSARLVTLLQDRRNTRPQAGPKLGSHLVSDDL